MAALPDIPRRQLQTLLREYGRELCAQPRRLEPLLRNACPEHRREVNILLGAYKERVAEELLAEEETPPDHEVFIRLAAQVRSHLSISEHVAKWAVESWAFALGLIDEGTTIDYTQTAALQPSLSHTRIGEPEKTWWTKLDNAWQQAFKRVVGLRGDINEKVLLKILNLDELHCGGEPVTHLTPLIELTSLQSLDCHKTRVKSLGPLRHVKQLQVVDCHHTAIHSLAPLRHLANLRKLVCYDTPIETLDALRGLVNLETLACHNTAVSSLQPLHRLEKLRVVVCRNTRVSKSDLEEFQRACPECVIIR